jgi:hypothetical protein
MPFRLDGSVPPLLIAGVAVLAILWRQLFLRGKKTGADTVIVCVLIASTALLERQMGRPWKYRNGPVRVWSGQIQSDQNSQQIADPYTFTHITHGAAFYGLTTLVMPKAAIGMRLVTAVAIEGAWESYENTDTVVQRYREATISLGYYGDSVLNSVGDIVACILGFLLTRKLPRAATWSWIVAVEVILALWIRDNLMLNILMLVWPLDVIKQWQAGG